jgi:hypothetical protein
MMKLSQFRSLIANMPVAYQAFASKRSIWASHENRNDNAGDAMRAIFGTSREVTLSRSDLLSLANKPDLAQFVMATIIWGYPRGMRGNHVDNVISHLTSLTQLLSDARAKPVIEWVTHYAKVRPIGGIGLSTYTKLLSFLSVQVQGHTALILDDRIIQVVKRGIFEELAPLQKLNSYKAPHWYPQYLECIHGLAENLEVSPENIEFFLFEFGLHLKVPPALEVAPTNLPQAAFP